MRINEILKATGGKLLSGDLRSDIDLASISTDSRTISEGQFFLPLKGNNFNGEEFIEFAFKKGATGTFTTQYSIPNTQYNRVTIRVKDTTDALQQLAHRNRMKFKIPVVGITGSNGKTTVKDMVAKVLSLKFNVLKNEGTKNNHIGVPLTLLRLNNSHDICVVEMGANHRGEIRILAGIARPTVAVITNVGPSHLEFFRNLKGVFAAKREILAGLKRRSLVIINGDDEYLSKIKSAFFKVMRFGFSATNDFSASGVSLNENSIKFVLNDRLPFKLNLIGAQNVSNALAAIAVGRNFNISYQDMKKALSEYSPAGMRLNLRQVGGVTVIDDVYNSNPMSMRSAIDALAVYPAKNRWIVSADMLELGLAEEEFHRAIGEMIARSGFNGLITFGRLSRNTSLRALECGMDKNSVWHCSDRAKIVDLLKKFMKKGDALLVKGSRVMKMEEVVSALGLKHKAKGS